MSVDLNHNVAPTAPPLDVRDIGEREVEVEFETGSSKSDGVLHECAICLERMDDTDKFIYIDCECRMNEACHARCVMNWLRRSVTCPTCCEPIGASQIYGNYDEMPDEAGVDGSVDEEMAIAGDSGGDGDDGDNTYVRYVMAMERRNDILRKRGLFRHTRTDRERERVQDCKKCCCCVTAALLTAGCVIMGAMG